MVCECVFVLSYSSENGAYFFIQLIGIFFREGESWLEQRRFTLRYLRDFGFGRRFDSFEKEIEIQIAQLIDIVKNGPKYDFENVRVILNGKKFKRKY